MNIADKILQNQDRDGMLRRSLERIIQLYTDKSHFVYELLQNAEDAGAAPAAGSAKSAGASIGIEGSVALTFLGGRTDTVLDNVTVKNGTEAEPAPVAVVSLSATDFLGSITLGGTNSKHSLEADDSGAKVGIGGHGLYLNAELIVAYLGHIVNIASMVKLWVTFFELHTGKFLRQAIVYNRFLANIAIVGSVDGEIVNVVDAVLQGQLAESFLPVRDDEGLYFLIETFSEFRKTFQR